MDNWQVLDLNSDPISGSPDQIRAMAAQLRRRAAAADRHTNRLQVISSNSGLLKLQGNFALLFREGLAILPAEARKIASAYTACAGILSSFANLMDQAKASARTALSQGMQADAQYRTLLGQFYALASGVSAIGGTWRGLNESSALALTAGRDVAVREFARRIGYNARLCEQQRQNARRFVLELAHAHHQAAIRCAALIRAVVPVVRGLQSIQTDSQAEVNPGGNAGRIAKLGMEQLREIAVEVSRNVLNSSVAKSYARQMVKLRLRDPNAQVVVPGRGGFLGLVKFFYNRGGAVPRNLQNYKVSDANAEVQEWHGGVTRFIKDFKKRTGRTPQPGQVRITERQAKGSVKVQNPNGPGVGRYHTLPRRLPKNLSDVEIGLALQRIVQTGRMPAGVNAQDQQLLAQLSILMFGRETHRGVQNAAFAPMTISLIQQGHMTIKDAFAKFHAPKSRGDNVRTGGEYPASMRGAAKAMEQLDGDERNREMLDREKQIAWRWATVFLNHERGMIVESPANAERIMKGWILRFYGIPN